jgi:hypothetical protein
VEKLAHFHDLPVDDFIPLLLAYKLRMQQTERLASTSAVDGTSTGSSYLDGVQKSAMDIHYYLDGDNTTTSNTTIVRVDKPAVQRRFETYFAAQIAQCADIRKQAAAIDPII